MNPLTQLHLDFHTAPVIPSIGKDFCPDEFAKTIKEANIQSVNVFAKCHHGMCYHLTKVGVMHPNLTFDLFGEMLTALKKQGIRTVAYIPVGWEEEAAKNLNWVEISMEGVVGGKSPLESGYYSWRKLCLNKRGYIEYLKSYIDELLANYEFEGFWFDIISQYYCICDDCRQGMHRMGLDPENKNDVGKYGLLVVKQFQDEITQYIRERNPDLSIYYNGSWDMDDAFDTDCTMRNLYPAMTHMEIESLPSGQWGYNHFPLQVNYWNKDNKEVVGMNGIFHTSWGDHGSFRNIEALEYESFRMIANGACCCIGDQLHPCGVLNQTKYKRIRQVYGEILKREEWCRDSKKDSEVAIMLTNRVPDTDYSVTEGALRIFTELHIPYDIIDREDSLENYKLLILPDKVYFDNRLTEKVRGYLDNGGKLIATYHSGLNEEKTKFMLDYGAEYQGEMEYVPTFLDIQRENGFDIEPMEYVSRCGSTKVTANSAKVLSHTCTPYFNRTYENFSSHMHFPCEKKTEYASVIRHQNTVYIAVPVFSTYMEYGETIWRELIKSAIKELDYSPKVRTDLPMHCEVTVRQQSKRTIVHIVNYFSQRKSRKLDIVDSMIPLYSRHMGLRTKHAPKRVYVAPQELDCAFEMQGEYCEVSLPELAGHTMVVFDWE